MSALAGMAGGRTCRATLGDGSLGFYDYFDQLTRWSCSCY